MTHLPQYCKQSCLGGKSSFNKSYCWGYLSKLSAPCKHLNSQILNGLQMTHDNCDVQEMLAGLRSDFQQLKQHREKVFDGTNAFLDQLFDTKFDAGAKGIDYGIDFSDEESDDEKPTRMRVMSMRTQPIFDRKPVKAKPKPTFSEAPPPPPPVIKPVVLDTACQTRKATLKTTETQSTARFDYVDQAVVATTHAETQTKSLKRRHEATNTESVLPSYENVCIAFLESILSDAPVFLGQGPKPEQVEDIIMAFLDQLMRDASRMDTDTPGKAPPQHQTSSFGTVSQAIARQTGPHEDAAVQHSIQKQTTATQSFVALKSLDAPKPVVHIAPDDGRRRMFTLQTAPCFEIWPKVKKPLRVNQGDNFQYPPSLRSAAKPVLAMRPGVGSEFTLPGRAAKSVSAETQTQQHMLQIDVLNSEDVSVVPSGRPGPVHEAVQQRPQMQMPQRQVPAAPPAPKLLQLQVTPLADIEELSNFNLESMMAEVETSSDDEVGEGSSSLNYSSSIASSKISDILDGVSVGEASGSSDILGESGLMSSGEVRDSSGVISGLSSSENPNDPWKWAK